MAFYAFFTILALVAEPWYSQLCQSYCHSLTLNQPGLDLFRVSLVLLPWPELATFGLVLAFTIRGPVHRAVQVLLSLGFEFS